MSLESSKVNSEELAAEMDDKVGSQKLETDAETGSSISCSKCRSKFSSQVGMEIHECRNDNLSQRDNTLMVESHGTIRKHETSSSKIRQHRHLQCMHCSETFKRTESREAHLKAEHPEILPNEICEERPKRFHNKRSLRIHKLSHSLEKSHSCQYCEEKFNSKIFLYAHEKTHSTIDSQPYLCQYCTKTFRTKYQLEKHERQTVHSTSNEKNFQCSKCSKSFQTRGSLKLHFLTHDRDYHEKIGVCGACGKICPSPSALKRHELRHVVRHQCQLCEKNFVTKLLLQEHGHLHAGIRPFKCKVCSKDFTRKSGLKAHEASVHSEQNQKPFVCQHCQKGFTRMELWKVHERTHSGEKPHSCQGPGCDERFHSKKGLNRHTSLYHPKGGKKPKIKRERTRIKDFPCRNCDKKFVSLEAVRYHEQRKHSTSSEQPFICDECGKGFQRIYFLQVHQRIHKGEKPFGCSCKKNFRSKESLAIHRKKCTL